MNDETNLVKTETFESPVASIQSISQQLTAQAAKAVNISLTLRNWMIGYYIAQYELQGADRAKYGDKLLDTLAQRLVALQVSTCSKRRLYQYLRFYQMYPGIVRSVTAQFRDLLPPFTPDSSEAPMRSPTAQLLIENLSYTHIEHSVALETEEKRQFYESQCISGRWSVRELKRQIGSLLYERSELSVDKQKLAEQTVATAETALAQITIRDPYIFGFLGLRPAEVMSESQLEDQLLDKLQDLLLEMGEGFCFEARQT